VVSLNEVLFGLSRSAVSSSICGSRCLCSERRLARSSKISFTSVDLVSLIGCIECPRDFGDWKLWRPKGKRVLEEAEHSPLNVMR